MSYSKFKQYGEKFSEHYWGDYVHNIWLRYFEKHGKDLFQEGKSNRWIFKAIKNEFINSLYGSDRIECILRKMVDDVTGHEYDGEFILDSDPGALDILVYNDLDRWIKDKIRRYCVSKQEASKSYSIDEQIEKHLMVYEMMKFNSSTKEIAEEVGIKEQNVSYYKKQIREAINHMAYTNPFTGSKIKIKKAVTEAQWEKRKDSEDFDLEDYNEYYKLFIHRESGEGWLVRLKEEKTNPYLK